VKPKVAPLHALMMAIGAGALAISVWLRTYFPTWRWHQEPLHSAMESIGGLAAIAMGVALLHKRDPNGARFYPVAGGFLGMGVLEIFHAVVEPADAFIFLRSMASLVGGIGFALIWAPRFHHPPHYSTAMLWTVSAGAAGFGFWALAFPEQVPGMIQNDVFTYTAVVPQAIACMLFTASAVGFSSDYRRGGGTEDALFASLAFLFALAEIMFVYSTLWDSRWWFWHGIRLTAYLLVLYSMVQGYRRMVGDLENLLVQTREAEEAARLSEEQLRHAVDKRERMAQDLHDGIIQSLFALGLKLERTRRFVMKDPEDAVEQLGVSAGGLKAIIRDLRGFITGLEPQTLEGRELAPALRGLAESMEASAELRCRVQIDPAVAELMTAEQAQHIIYIVREALSNSVRHAQARHEVISLQRRDQGARLLIEDDGSGFNPDLLESEGKGLKNMAARANKLGAGFEVRSQVGQGTRIIFDIPVGRNHV
jgi:signal transduction histidine kinase